MVKRKRRPKRGKDLAEGLYVNLCELRCKIPHQITSEVPLSSPAMTTPKRSTQG